MAEIDSDTEYERTFRFGLCRSVFNMMIEKERTWTASEDLISAAIFSVRERLQARESPLTIGICDIVLLSEDSGYSLNLLRLAR